MRSDNAITILHLSDLQFGRNHRFGRLHLPRPDDMFDSLFSRLRDDLDLLRNDPGLQPDLIIVTGDITEGAMPTEFADARELLERLCDHLQLKHDRVVLVPGNHDISRKACEAYFNQCEADERKPIPPFTPKWKHYVLMFQEFYKSYDNIRFTIEEPWTLFEVPELKVVVAGLNSTMAECHDIKLDKRHLWYEEYVRSGTFGHFGSCGEAQLRCFAEHLDGFKAKGWLRIGAVHHNYRRGATDDDDNLRDADDLERLLGDAINLLLHGHTHEGNLDRMPSGVPILSTGSAGVAKGVRPEEVPNQYEIIRLQSTKLVRVTRSFDLRRKRWMADPRTSKKGDKWHTEDNIALANVYATFPNNRIHAREPVDRPSESGPSNQQCSGGTYLVWCDDFLTRAAEVCRHRRPAAEVTPIVLEEPRLRYLRVVEKHDSFVRQYPVGIFEETVRKSDLELFIAHVDAKYRANDPALTSEIVYGGSELPSPGVIRHAEQRRVRLLSFVEYQGIIDFRGYLKRQTGTLEADTIYPPSLYVPQRMHFAIGSDYGQTDDAVTQVAEWLVSPEARFVLILGDFGTGKTFLLHELARRLGCDGHGLTPMLVELRALEKAQKVETLVAQHLAGVGVERIDLAAFRYMLQQGRIALLFDGFDELALRVSYDRAAEHFDTIVQAAAGDAKIVVTSRTQHFESEKQVRTVLYERAQPLPGLRYCRLLPFFEPQIRRFLRNRWVDEKEAEHWYDLLHHVKDLLGLSENPRMLGFITELRKEDIARAKKREGMISAASLYQLLLDRWLIFEYERAHPPGSQITLTREARWAAVNAIALRLWQKTEKFVTQAELAQEASSVIAQEKKAPPPADIVAHLIGSGSLLRRDEEGCFFFVHQSVMEWLVVREAADQIRNTGESVLLATRPLSELMAEFLCDLAGRDAALAWARAAGEREVGIGEFTKNNALEVLKRLGVNVSLNLAGQYLRGKDFAGQSLVSAELSGADLTEARFVDMDLSGARLDGAKLMRADLTRATLTGASLEDADLSEARLLGTDLRDARIRGARLRRAKLIGAKAARLHWDAKLTWGAALPGSKEMTPCWLSVGACRCLGWSPDSELLATGHDNGMIRLWEASSGKGLGQFNGHKNAILSVAFSPDGCWLVSSGGDRTVRLWEVASGKELERLSEREDIVMGIAFSSDGRWVAGASDDSTVYLWKAASGKELRQFTGHQGRVRCVAFSPDGHRLASGSDDSTVRLWDMASGRGLRRITAHQDSVRDVSFSPDGCWLASCSDDHTVRIWEAASGRELSQFNGHQSRVISVSFSPDGRQLVSSGGDGAVRLWEAASGRELRQFTGHKHSVGSVSFSPNGHWLVGGSYDATAYLWEASSGRELRRFTGYQNYVWNVVFSGDGRQIASGSSDHTVRLWEVASGRELRRFVGHLDWVLTVSLSSDGRWLASGSNDHTVRLWEAASGRELHQFTGHQNPVRSVSFSPNGQWLASASDDRTVRLWDLASGNESRCFTGHRNSVRSVSFSPDGQWLASASYDHTVRLWGVLSGRELRQFSGHLNSVLSVSVSPNAQLLASGSEDKTVRLWEVASGKELQVFTGHHDYVTSVSFSPDGRWLASASYDKVIRLWEVASGKESHRFSGHQNTIRSVSFSPNGRWLASSSDDNTIRLWHSQTGEHVATLIPMHEGWVVFTSEGRYKFEGNLAGGFWHIIGLCRFEPGELDDYVPGLRMRPDEPILDVLPKP
jgi:WD40 repeat protein/3',5'-cyclic AMP phosphodiesterase CpdA